MNKVKFFELIKDAAEKAKARKRHPHATPLRKQVFEYICKGHQQGNGPVLYGATDAELKEVLSSNVDSIRWERYNLQIFGWIEDSGTTRKHARRPPSKVWIRTTKIVEDI